MLNSLNIIHKRTLAMRFQATINLATFCSSCCDIVYICVWEGLNFIAGLLLLVVKDEEQTFSLLSTLLNSILPGDSWYTRS